MKFLILILLAAFIVPFTKQGVIIEQKDRWSGDVIKKRINLFVFILPVVFGLYVTVAEYFGLVDNNINSINLEYTWVLAALIGAGLYFHPNLPKWEMYLKCSVIGVLLIVLISTLISGLMAGEKKYNSVKVIKKDISEVFTEEDTPFSVPMKTASKKMNKYFGELEKVSYYDLGEVTPQIVNGEPVYVAPIEYNGYFKSKKAGNAPGYITMSGTNPNADPIVKFDFKMKIIPSAYFGKNLERNVRKEFPNLKFYGEPKFEIDDNGKPFYTRTYGDFVSARSGFVAEGIILIDPQTGEIKKYTKNNKPEFIDSILNSETAKLMNHYFGELVHGLWNPSDTDVKIPTESGTKDGVTPIIGKNGKLYFFSDFTSPKEGVESALGYSLIDSEENTLYYYSGKKLKGLMDGNAAKTTVNTKFKKEGWKGTMPVLYNVYDRASWVVPVTDDAGLVQSYAIVAGSNGNLFATGATLKQAFKSYKTTLERDITSVEKASKISKEAKAVVQVIRVYKERTQDSTIVEVLSKDKVFLISANDFTESKFIEPGDTLEITYMDNGEQEVAVIDYANITVNQLKQ